MHAQKQEAVDPIRSLVHEMREDEVLRIFRQLEGRIERVAEWFADTAGDSSLLREKFGVGKFVVRILYKKRNGQLLIRRSVVVNVTRWEAAVAS